MPNMGEHIRKARLNAGLTQKQLADFLDVAQNTISNWEQGTREPNHETVIKLSNYFKVPISFLFYGVDIDPNDKKIAPQK